MKINIVTGVSIYEAAKNLFNCIDKNDFDTNYFIVVPDRYSLQAEKLLFETLNLKSTFNINVMSLTSLAEKILKEEGIEYKNSSVLEGVLFVKKACEQLKNELCFYKKITPNFCYEMYKSIIQIKSSQIKPEDLKYEGSRKVLKDKFHDMALIYSKYQEIASSKIDSTDLLDLCADNAEKCKFLQGSVVMFAGFDSFTATNYKLLTSIALCVKEMFISFPQSLNIGNDYIYEKDIFDKIKKLAEGNDIDVSVKANHTSLNENQKVLANQLFSYQIQPVDREYIHISNSSSIKEEVEYIANLINYQVYKGARYRDFSIGCPNLDSYKTIIDQVFSQRKIPYYIDSAVVLSESILVRFLLKLCELKKKNFTNEDLLYLADSCLLEIDDREELIAFLNEKKVYGRKAFNIYLKERFGELFDIIEKIDSAKTQKDFVQVLREVIESVKENYDKYLLKLEEKKLLKEKNIEEQSIERLNKIFDVLEEEEEISFENFVELFKLSISLQEVSSLPAYCDSVFVGDITSSYFGESDMLIVLGASRGVLPVMMKDTGLITDRELKQASLQANIEPTIKMINRRNRFKLFNNLLVARKNLYISYLDKDSEGKPTDKAQFVSSLMKIFSIKESMNTADIDYFGIDQDLERFLFSTGGNYVSARQKLLENLKTKQAPYNFVASLADVLKTNYEDFYLEREKLNCEDLRDKFFTNDHFSVTQIESFFDCPFKHFVDYILKPKMKSKPELEKFELGNLYHFILEKFVEKFGRNLPNVSDADLENFLKENIEKSFDFSRFEFLANRDIVIKNIYTQCVKICKKVIKENRFSSYLPQSQEKVIQGYLQGIDLKIKGKIDRIDAFNKKIRLIDYKTGKISKNIYTDLYFGKKLQLFLYSAYLKEVEDANIAGVYYFNAGNEYENENKYILEGVTLEDGIEDIDNRLKESDFSKSDIINARKSKKGEVSFNKATQEQFTTLQNYALDITKLAVEEIEEGKIAPNPIDRSCEFCKYQGICLYSKNNGIRKSCTKKMEDFIKGDLDEKV